ncbi:hypothetical protein EDB19DRAFT_1832130 [Suillus lakei]|nr:hypothetical protein EDB19DRAFT_1832130 [Suillus lakei]
MAKDVNDNSNRVTYGNLRRTLISSNPTQHHSSNAPIALTPSTNRLYSLNNSPTSGTLKSSSSHTANRLLGAGSYIEMGDGVRDDAEQEFEEFSEEFTDKLVEFDSQTPRSTSQSSYVHSFRGGRVHYGLAPTGGVDRQDRHFRVNAELGSVANICSASWWDQGSTPNFHIHVCGKIRCASVCISAYMRVNAVYVFPDGKGHAPNALQNFGLPK